VWAETIDISETGVSLRASRPLPTGEEVDFDLVGPGGADVAGRARVVRRAGPRVYGLEFGEVRGEIAALLR
jgi:hypothetical protein